MKNVAAVASWMLAPAMFAAMIAVSDRSNLMGDFRAFYCAGTVIAQRANPYLEEPLHTCERRIAPIALRSVTLPAPLPPYALVPFVPFASVSFPVASVLFTLLSVAATSGAVVLFARSIGTSIALLNLAFAAILSQAWFLGQPVSFVFLALAGGAVLLQRDRVIAASACVVCATAEPHLALPVIVAMLVLIPRSRVPLVGFGMLLGLVSVLAVGVPTTISYVRDVIPAHALANAYEWQFSLTSILTSVGVGAPSAVRWGEGMYAVMVVLGIVVAARLWRATGDRAMLVLVPPAFAVYGGVHVHLQQLMIAFPAILMAYERFPRVRVLAASGITFAMIPWNTLSATVMTGFTPLLVGVFARATLGARRGLVCTVLAAGIALSVLALALGGFAFTSVPFVPHTYPPDALAEASWGAFSRAELSRQSVLMQWLRVPTLVGLTLGLLALTRSAFSRHSDGPNKPATSRTSGDQQRHA